jgi:hypothetical protein
MNSSSLFPPESAFNLVKPQDNPSGLVLAEIAGWPVHVRRGLARIASIFDEEWIEHETVLDPEVLISKLREKGPPADLFTFAQRISEPPASYPYPVESDNAAVIRVPSYKDWWERLSQDARRNVRLAAKRGVVVKECTFDDQFVEGIRGIYNETAIRQGRRFWHYGKTFEKVKRENATYQERSAFLGAFLGEELIGFIKLVYVGQTASIMQILSKNAHLDKKPPNALLSKAVELCERMGKGYLIYCKYQSGHKAGSPLTEFKRRNGFERMDFPRYYVPLSIRGKLVLRTALHHGLRGAVPESLASPLIAARSRILQRLSGIPFFSKKLSGRGRSS